MDCHIRTDNQPLISFIMEVYWFIDKYLQKKTDNIQNV